MQAPAGGTAYFVPPLPPSQLDFAAWLAERTPPHAATVALMPPGPHGPIYLPRVREAIASPTSFFGRRRRGSAPAVHAAYLADVLGVRARELAQSGQFPFSTERGARHHIRDGRLTAADLGAWPWAVVEGKPLSRNWWADDTFALALGEWAIADQLVSVRPMAESAPRRYTAAARLPVA